MHMTFCTGRDSFPAGCRTLSARVALLFSAHLLQSVNGSLVALRYQLRCLVSKVPFNLVQVVIIPEHGMRCTAWGSIPQHVAAADARPLAIDAPVDATIPWCIHLVMELSVDYAVARRSMHAAALRPYHSM